MSENYKFDTLFLDRDGVINVHRPDDYVKNWNEFIFEANVPEAIKIISGYFKRIIIVTNQRGVGKGIMSEEELRNIHDKMCEIIISHGGKIDAVYYCTDKDENSPDRKPNTGMGLQARKDFPDIDFSRSYMVGDSPSDMEFGRRLGMNTVWIKKDPGIDSLMDFAEMIINNHLLP